MRRVHLDLGQGFRLISEDYYVEEIEKAGMSIRSFRSFCKALGVVRVQIGRTWFIEPSSFLEALRYITLIGQPDFLASGSEELRKGRTEGRAVRVDPDAFRENMPTVIAELLATRKLSGLHITAGIRDLSRRVADLIVQNAIRLQPVNVHHKLGPLAVQKIKAELGITDDKLKKGKRRAS